jgi:hypothetical protein
MDSKMIKVLKVVLLITMFAQMITACVTQEIRFVTECMATFLCYILLTILKDCHKDNQKNIKK